MEVNLIWVVCVFYEHMLGLSCFSRSDLAAEIAELLARWVSRAKTF